MTFMATMVSRQNDPGLREGCVMSMMGVSQTNYHIAQDMPARNTITSHISPVMASTPAAYCAESQQKKTTCKS
jgi:hypothetical protein